MKKFTSDMEVSVDNIYQLDGSVVEQMRQHVQKIASQYKREIAKADIPAINQFKMVGSHVVTFNRDAIPCCKVTQWFNAPQTAEPVTGEDQAFELNDLSGMNASAKIEERGRDYQLKHKVTYISLDGTQGKALVAGTEPYVLEFEYADGMIHNLTCSCSYGQRCKHEVATMLQLRETLDLIQANYGQEFAESGYFAALNKSDFIDCVMENAELGSFSLS